MDPLNHEISRLFRLAKDDPSQETGTPFGFSTNLLSTIRAEESANSARIITTCRRAVLWSCSLAAAAVVFSLVDLQSHWDVFTMRGAETRLANSVVWAQFR